MSQTAIRVTNLGQSYLVGHETESRHRYVALRDVIARSVKGVARKTRDMLGGRPVMQGDEIEEFWALKDVSFNVVRGDVVGVVGRNGAGKSTLLKVLSRITEPTEGRVEISGRVASLLEVGTGFHPELTGRENIYLNGAILGMTRGEIRAKFDEIVLFAEVERFLDTPVKHYSSGMYMRLAFAVAAHLEPEILVVDEVLAVGDSEFQKKCLGKMRAVAGEGRTVLFVSHNMAAVRALCNKALLLRSGRLALSGTTGDVIGAYSESTAQAHEFHRAPLRTGHPHVVKASVDRIDAGAGRRIARVLVSVHAAAPASVEVSALVRDNMGASIGFAPVGSLKQEAPAQLVAGETTFMLSIDVSSLALGSYALTLQVSRPLGEIFDQCHDCLTFDIGSESFDGVIHPFRQDWAVGSVLFASTIEPAREGAIESGAHR